MLKRAKRSDGGTAHLVEELERLRPLEKEVAECRRRIAEQQTDLARARNDAERHFKAADALGRLLSRLRPAPGPPQPGEDQDQQLQDSREQLQAALQVIRTQDEELERNAHVSQRLITALEGQLGRMREALSAGDAPQARTEAALDVKLEELHSLQALTQQLQGQVAQQEDRIRELEGELSNRVRVPEETPKEPESSSGELDSARAQVEEMQASCVEHMQDLRWLETALSDSTRREKKLDTVVSHQAERLVLFANRLEEQVSLVEGLRCTLLVIQHRLAVREAPFPKPQPTASKRESQLQALALALEANVADTCPAVPAEDPPDETQSLETRLSATGSDLRSAQERITAQAEEISGLTAKLRDTESRLATQEDFIRSELSWRAFTRDAEKARGDLLQKELDGVRAQLASSGSPLRLWHKVIKRGPLSHAR
ncbi:hypothetical protein AURDEDRAFT_126000 [Auricularia subglabra TFB-10046 SS5]|nr:hypothetical protein AURDEDRAFT_126000 [Auricularia subglabra TFB-10046 SS5]